MLTPEHMLIFIINTIMYTNVNYKTMHDVRKYTVYSGTSE